MEPVFWSATNHTHEEIMEHATEVLGYDNLVKCVPFTLDEIKGALEKGDKYLNTLPMKTWDYASGFVWHRSKDTETLVSRPETPLVKLYIKAGLPAWSNSQGVSLLKYIAKKMAESEVANA